MPGENYPKRPAIWRSAGPLVKAWRSLGWTTAKSRAKAGLEPIKASTCRLRSKWLWARFSDCRIAWATKGHPWQARGDEKQGRRLESLAGNQWLRDLLDGAWRDDGLKHGLPCLKIVRRLGVSVL